MLDKLKSEKVVAVIRADDHETAMKYVDACMLGGLKAIELTYTIPDVCPLIEAVVAKHPDALVGIGSVLTAEQVANATKAGAKYIVSAGFVNEVQEYCNSNDLIYMPGAMTVTEIIASNNNGNKITKIFPGDVYSPGYIKSIKGPLPHAQVMVTGGVDINNVEEWFANGVTLVGVGSSLTKPGQSGDFEGVTALAKQFKEKVAKW